MAGRIFIVGLIAALCLFAAERASADTLDAVRARHELAWGADIQGGEPYVFEGADGKLVGFEVAIAERIAAQLGARARFVQADWSNLVPSLERSDFDIVL